MNKNHDQIFIIYFFLCEEEDELWANIAENGRETFFSFDREGYPDLLEKVEANKNDEELCKKLIAEAYTNASDAGIGFISKLPHIEDASPALQHLWKIAYETEYVWDGIMRPHENYSEENFSSAFGMTSIAFDEQVKKDIDKYHLPKDIIGKELRPYSMYDFSWHLAEYFSKAVTVA